MTPENYNHSLPKYTIYPLRIVRAISETPYYLTKKRKFLKTKVVTMPPMYPIMIDPNTTSRNLKMRKPISDPSISKLGSLLSSTISLIASKRVIAIVSLYKDYPSMIENSLGYRALSTTFSVTIGSILQKAAAISRISQLDKVITC